MGVMVGTASGVAQDVGVGSFLWNAGQAAFDVVGTVAEVVGTVAQVAGTVVEVAGTVVVEAVSAVLDEI